MPRESKSYQNSNDKQIEEKFWQLFFKDDFKACLELIDSNVDLSANPIYRAKVLLRQGNYTASFELLEKVENCALRDFLYFLLTANPVLILNANYEDDELKLYQAQTIYLTRLFLGQTFLDENDLNLDPDELVEESFNKYIKEGKIDKAILASIQSIEIVLEEQIFSKDFQLPIILEQLDNLAELADNAQVSSTKAKVVLIKAKLIKDKELAQDAEILFGKDDNKFGLGEVYFTYAKDFGDFEAYQKAKEYFEATGSQIAIGYINEALSSDYLQRGEIQEAREIFESTKEYLKNCGCFEKYGLIIQEISLQAISGKYQKVKESVHDLIQSDTPAYFSAQAYQLLANTVLQLGEAPSLAQGYIQTSIDIFQELKRYPQLLNAKNFLFQSYMIEGNVDQAIKLCNKIIHLAAKLGNDDLKASKYMDLAYLLVRQNADKEFSEELADQIKDNFKKAIDVFRDTDNFIGEAEAYQSMANIYASIGRLEDALENFISAKKLFKSEKAFLQAAITDVLIGVLLLSYVVLNDHSYLLTMKHLDQALLYFAKENLSDLHWKTLYYIADLNHKYYFMIKDKPNADIYKNKAMKFYQDMYFVIEDLEHDSSNLAMHNPDNFGVTIDSAYDKAYQYFISIGEDETAKKFKKHLN
jgi:tetratricopeptide (TPR) repeat protein